MRYVLNVVYAVFLSAFSPFLIYKFLTTGKYRRGLLCKFLGNVGHRAGDGSCAWFHGVSVGEIHLLRQVIAAFRRQHPNWECVISTTTDTGFEEARKGFPDLPVFYWPLDFSWAVRRALGRMRPNLVVLAEGEIWPNFILAASDRGVPVATINARLSPRSGENYDRLKWFARPILRRIGCFCVQTQEYAEAFRKLGVDPERIHVTGSVKYDGVNGDRQSQRTRELARLLNVREADRVWIAGSTQAPEEEIVLEIYRRLRHQPPHVRLIIVPRQRERFDEVAALLERSGMPYVRRSLLSEPIGRDDPIILMDTIGELGPLWGLADVAFVGGSLDGRRGGQNMIEPAAYGAAVVFGPHVWNFKDTAARLLEAGAAVQIKDGPELDATVRKLLSDADLRSRLGTAAQQFVRTQQGATGRTVELLNRLIGRQQAPDLAA
jgi:3-deoxy-D-manno-octulosonic-acid transferase